MKKNKLIDADINEVTLCAKGIQQDSHIVLAKSEDGGSTMKDKIVNIIKSMMEAFGVKKDDMIEMAEPIMEEKAVELAVPIEGEVEPFSGNPEPGTFQDELAEVELRDFFCDEIYDATSALKELFEEIMESSEENKAELMEGGIEDFHNEVSSLIPEILNPNRVEKAGKKISGNRLDRLKTMHADLGKLIGETDAEETKETLKEEVKAELAEENKPENKPEEKPETPVTKAEVVVDMQDTQSWSDKLNEAKVEIEKAANEEKETIAKALIEKEEIIAKMLFENETKEYITKAQKFDRIFPNSSEAGSALQTIAKSAPDAYEVIEKALLQAQTFIAASDILKEFGSNHPAENINESEVAEAQINKMAKEYSVNYGVPELEAYNKVIKTPRGKELYSTYRNNKQVK